MKRILFPLLLILGGFQLGAQKLNKGKSSQQLLFSDEFLRFDTTVWITEMEPLPDSKVYAANGKLVLDTKRGITVWLNKKLSGNIRIEYTRKILVEGGINDRLSDLNTFWMASDPKSPDLFTRMGKLEQYDSLRLYYVGMGGNNNRTTRFRKYTGTGERLLLKEFTDPAHLLVPNTVYRITIEMNNGLIRFLVNDQLFFSYHDPDVLREGYFGFRSTKSRQEIEEIKVYRLLNNP
jgi:hypothetical protein